MSKNFCVDEIISFGGYSKEDIIKYCITLNQNGDDDFSNAIRKFAEIVKIAPMDSSEFEYEELGVSCIYNELILRCGFKDYFVKNNIDTYFVDFLIFDLEKRERKFLFVSKDEKLIGFVLFS